MNGHVGKPISIEAMTAEIKRVLGNAPRAQVQQPLPFAPRDTRLSLNTQQGLANIPSSPELYPQLLQLFYDHHQADIQRTRQRLNDGQIRVAQTIIHDLKGVLASIGAERLHQLVEQIESGLRNDDADALQPLIGYAQTEMTQLLAAIRAYLERDNADQSVLSINPAGY